MKLARKLTFALVAGVLAVMAGYAWVQIRREVAVLDADLAKNEKFGRGAAAALESIWASDGEARAREVLATIDRHGPDVIQLRWRWLRELRRHPPELLTAADLDALTRRNVITQRRTTGGRWLRHIYVPMSIAGAEPAVLEVAESLEAERRYIDMTHRHVAIATFMIVVVCGLTTMALGYWFVGRPLARLRHQARAIAAGELAGRADVLQRDEIGDLAAELNRMCGHLAEARARLAKETEARIATLEQLRHTDRLTTVGRLAAGVAHELGTPLNVITGRAGKILAIDGGSGPVGEYARTIREQAARMVAVIRQLLDFSRRQGPKLGLCSLRTLVAQTIDLLKPLADRHGVRIELTAPDAEPFVRVDQNQVQQALANIMMNGIQAMPRGGRLRVAVDACTAHPPGEEPRGAGGAYLRIVVEDEGHGIASEHLPYLFEPFFTTKGVGEGTGLGLSVAHGIVAEHGGWIDVRSEVGAGTRMTMYFAAAQPRTTEAAS